MKLGTPATGEDFRGRQQELNDLWRYLGNEHIKLPGARRLGKTSILMRLVDQAPEHGVFAQWVDVSSMQTTADFLDLLDREFPAQGISVLAHDAFQGLGGEVRKELGFGLFGGMMVGRSKGEGR